VGSKETTTGAKMSILTIKQVTNNILKMLDDIVTEEFPAEEREEAKVRINKEQS
jgi:hypothetical protein